MDGNDEGTTFTDATGRHTPVRQGGAVVTSTAESKFGGASASWNGLANRAHRIDVPSSTDFTFGLEDFTIDFWVYWSSNDLTQNTPTAPAGARFPLTVFDTTATPFTLAGRAVSFTKHGASQSSFPGEVNFGIAGGAGIWSGQANKPTTPGWYHYAGVRANGTMYFFQNGVLLGTQDASARNINGTYEINIGNSKHTDLAGTGNPEHVEEVRIIKGLGIWTSNFTPPTNPYTPFELDPTTVLLLQSNTTNGSTTFTDSSSKNHTVTPTGTAQHSTARQKFGGSSIYFDNTAQTIDVADSDDFEFGTDDLTIDFWVNFADVERNANNFIGQWNLADSTNNHMNITYNGLLNRMYFDCIFGGSAVVRINSDGWNAVNNQWYHIAWVRQGTSNWYLFIDGISQSLNLFGGSYSGSLPNFDSGLRLGTNKDGNPQTYAHSYFDEVRVLKGNAAYTANFTPPKSPYGPL